MPTSFLTPSLTCSQVPAPLVSTPPATSSFLPNPIETPLSSVFCRDVIVFLSLAVLDIVQKPMQLGDELDAAMHRLMEHCVEQLISRMIQLMQDMEQTQEQNNLAGEALLFDAFQQGGSRPLEAEAFCWRTGKRSFQPESSFPAGQPQKSRH